MRSDRGIGALLLVVVALLLTGAPPALATHHSRAEPPVTRRSVAEPSVVRPPAAAAATDAETRLAQKYAPVVRVVQQPEACDTGEPYRPADVDAFLGDDTVALRGPWDDDDLISIGPTAQTLSQGLDDYHLDFPGDPLAPGCDYEEWARSQTRGRPATVYAHVVTDRARPGRLALQYWFFWAFNDFNNTHEGDWEVVQLEFDAPDAATALTRDPARVGYSQHEGVETAGWGDAKLQIEDGTHPVVYPASGSHASYFEPQLYLGRSGQRGFGCDDALGPQDELRPTVKVIPQDSRAAVQAYPWLAFRGHWGEREQAFYDGPTGPNMKDRWTQPVRWVEQNAHDNSYAVPVGGLFGTQATDLFCSGVGTGSTVLRRVTASPATAIAVLAVVLAFAVWQAQRTAWEGSYPLRAARRRSWGQTVGAAVRMYASRPAVFTGIGLLALPLALLLPLLSRSDAEGPTIGGWGGDTGNGANQLTLAGLAASALLGLGVVLVQAATSRAVAEIDAGREVDVRSAYRLVLRLWRPLLLSCLIWAVAVGLLTLATVWTVLVAVVIIVLWSLFVPVVVLEERGPVAALRRSTRLVLPRTLRVVSLLVVTLVLASATGPLVGFVLLLVFTGLPFELLNVLSGLIYVVLTPLVALTAAYVYFDAAVQESQRTSSGSEALPAEVEDTPWS